MPDLSLNDYGVIGNQSSSALISRLGSIDWCCFPDLDSPSHLGAILDQHKGGRFQICPVGDFRSEQRYLQRTQVLETTFETPFGRALLLDWMPMNPEEKEKPIIYRRIEILHGKMNWLLNCSPQFDYGQIGSTAEHHADGVLFRGKTLGNMAFLRSSLPLEIGHQHDNAVSRFTLNSGDHATFSWQWGCKSSSVLDDVQNFSLKPTLEWWRTWAHRCNPTGCSLAGPWHDTIARSALTLKVLTQTTGAIAEAITTSISGISSSPRTWDYRYAWIRDSAQAIQALASLGYLQECHQIFCWLCDILERDGVEGLQPVYRLDGGKSLEEGELPHLSGYLQSRPVRVGNLSSSLFQLDIYGHVIIAAFEYYKISGQIPAELWPKLVSIADYVCHAWRRPDHGPWETRSKPEHFVGSKIYCWAALDRAIQLSTALKKIPHSRWITEREILHKTILTHGFDAEQGCFIRAFGDPTLDSIALIIPQLGFLPIDDPRVTLTLHAIESRLCQGVLVRRYEGPDGVDGPEGFHLISSFLLTSCLALAGRVDEAGDRLAELCTYATPLGIYGEQVDPKSSETSGNFPSASVHISLINAGLAVGEARGRYFHPKSA